MKVRLNRVRSGHASLRDSVISGWCDALPVRGEEFFMTAPPRDRGNIRMITTTPVVKVWTTATEVEFETRNSTYKLEILEDVDGLCA